MPWPEFLSDACNACTALNRVDRHFQKDCSMLNNSLTLENISKRFASRPGSSSQLQVVDDI